MPFDFAQGEWVWVGPIQSHQTPGPIGDILRRSPAISAALRDAHGSLPRFAALRGDAQERAIHDPAARAEQ